MILRTKILINFIPIILLLLFVGGIGGWTLYNYQKHSKMVNHTNEVIGKINRLERAIIDMETGTRGFLITNDEIFLEPYREGLKYDILFSELITKVSDNPPQVKLLQSIHYLVDKWETEIGDILIKMRREEVINIVSSAKGKILMDEIRLEISKFRNAEIDLLKKREEITRQAADKAVNYILTASLVSIIVASINTWYLTLFITKIIGGEPSEIASLTKKISKGNLDIQITQDPPHEGIFNSVVTMMHSLRKNKKDLQNKRDELMQLTTLEKEVRNRIKNLEKTNEQLQYFAYTASHDLKAPLRAISNLATWIGEEIENPTEKIEKYIKLMQERTNWLQQLVDGILEVSRIGKMNTGKEQINISKIINEIEIPENIELEMDIQVTINANPIRVSQVFSNLISNSIKHHDRPTGKIKIAHKETDDANIISITDDGPGIPAKYQEKVFQIFKTLHPHKDSTGIGLAIVKKIMEEEYGGIKLHSKGRGTTFILTFDKNKE